tara:strand:+ start:56 stop:232 length:177 start_codon:yes stop_codon:yes gene_type:complete
MTKIDTLGMFHTPKDMRELEAWINKARDPMVLTGAMMMYNLMATIHNDMIDQEVTHDV